MLHPKKRPFSPKTIHTTGACSQGNIPHHLRE
nr:MAG TPA: hypothetical protein [Caudoviricetes sp.]